MAKNIRVTPCVFCMDHFCPSIHTKTQFTIFDGSMRIYWYLSQWRNRFQKLYFSFTHTRIAKRCFLLFQTNTNTCGRGLISCQSNEICSFNNQNNVNLYASVLALFVCLSARCLFAFGLVCPLFPYNCYFNYLYYHLLLITFIYLLSFSVIF